MNHTLIKSRTFTAELVREHSSVPMVDDLGEHESTMDLCFYGDNTGFIDWDIPALDEAESIGLWFDIGPDGTRTLTDYDGIMSLPQEAIQLMRDAGVIVPEEFE